MLACPMSIRCLLLVCLIFVYGVSVVCSMSVRSLLLVCPIFDCGVFVVCRWSVCGGCLDIFCRCCKV